ncbi:MAG TPA: ergothioneine biosynthesis protein EgtC [Acidimicrobiales bacterium]|nr:ergothioneine biosynthesis protein EgtC [Acidimicrobiales bacterium]
MCRHLGYVGPPISLHDLLVAPPFGLEHQSYAPRHQAHGLVNADGWGVGWYVDGEAAPARYRTARPMWADTSFAGMAGHVRTTVAVASVRSATPPAPVEESGVAPFRAGRILFAHNGVVRGFAEGVGTELRRRLAPPTESRLEGRSDSEVLFGLLLDTLDDGADLTGGVAGAIEVGTDLGGRYNLVVSDGDRVLATRRGDTLVVGRLGSGHVVASEPLDDSDDWQAVPEGSLVTMTADGVDIQALTHLGRGAA